MLLWCLPFLIPGKKPPIYIFLLFSKNFDNFQDLYWKRSTHKHIFTSLLSAWTIVLDCHSATMTKCVFTDIECSNERVFCTRYSHKTIPERFLWKVERIQRRRKRFDLIVLTHRFPLNIIKRWLWEFDEGLINQIV